MTEQTAILGMQPWLRSPAGRYLLDWEQAVLDTLVADRFGFHALQLGGEGVDALRHNRMPHRWLARQAMDAARPEQPEHPERPTDGPRADLYCDFDALPFEANSLDLLVLPHCLEFAPDPHHRLREAHRVLRPEGRLLILGLNPVSLWGLRQRLGRRFLPQGGRYLGYWRLRDWLQVLGCEVQASRFGCWRLPVQSQVWLDKSAWLDHLGPTWWPVLGAAYCIEAVKRVHGMRLVGLAPTRPASPRRASVALPSRVRHHD